jgi:hypothetical protein
LNDLNSFQLITFLSLPPSFSVRIFFISRALARKVFCRLSISYMLALARRCLTSCLRKAANSCRLMNPSQLSSN